MIKVLHKSFQLLEYIVKQNRPVLPSEAAESLGLNPATAMRIIRELTELGYLEQSGPRKGYQSGPIAFHLANGCRYRHELYEELYWQIKECARKIGQSVLFATRHQDWRYIVCHYNFNTDFHIDDSPIRYYDLYETATGRILLANTPEPELRNIVAKHGLPDASFWPEGGKSWESLQTELRKIRIAGEVEIPVSYSKLLHVYATAFTRKGVFLGALGTSWPVNSSSELSKECIMELDRLQRNLSHGSNRSIPVN